ncbi:MAG TPA: hypothetical protein VG603_10885 [Chitinophagales bacterium]|nr:hypothetical protein [Chitinophagales bacterium]
MKIIKQILCLATGLVFIAGINGCKKDTNGTVTFYFDANGPDATVTLTSGTTSYTGDITQNYPNNAPSCGAAGCASFVLPEGTYNYSAASSLFNWNGSATVYAGQCSLIDLTQSTGSVTFWTNSSSLGTITVNVFGLSDNITQSFNLGPSQCGASGCANFLLPAGSSYSYTANSQSGAQWSGSSAVTPVIEKDNCYVILLQ